MSALEKCPTCNGDRMLLGIGCTVPDGGRESTSGPVEITCPECHGKGEIPPGREERRKAGALLKAERAKRGMGLREWCIATGESPSERSMRERGVVPPERSP